MNNTIPIHYVVIIIFCLAIVGLFKRGWIHCNNADKLGSDDMMEMGSIGVTSGSISLSASQSSAIDMVVTMIKSQQMMSSPNVNIITEYYLDSVEARYAVARPFVNYTMMTGLAGTIIGLFFMFSRMDGAISNALSIDGQQQYISSLSFVISSVKLAFSSSFAGVISSVLLSNKIRNADKIQSSRSSQIIAWIISQASQQWPTAASPIERLQAAIDNSLGKLFESQDKTSATIDRSLEVIKQLDATLADLPKAMDSTKQQLSSVAEVSKQLNDGIQKSFETACMLNEGIIKASGKLSEQIKTVGDMQHDLLKESESLIAHFHNDNIDYMAKTQELSKTISDEALTTRESIIIAKKSMDLSVAEMKETREETTAHTRTIINASHDLVSKANEILVMSQTMMSHTSEITSKLADVASAMDVITKPVSESTSQLQKSVDEIRSLAVSSIQSGANSGKVKSDQKPQITDTDLEEMRQLRNSVVYSINMLVEQIYEKFPDEISVDRTAR